jgi:hypothetical protein
VVDLAARAMHHRAIGFELVGEILADVEISETRAEELFDVVEGHHPDLVGTVVIRTPVDAVLLTEQNLKDPRTLARP